MSGADGGGNGDAAAAADTALPAAAEGRLARLKREKRERLLAQFVDRTAEMATFARVLDSDDLPVMVVTAATGMGKSALLMRMVHECALRTLARAEVEWTDIADTNHLSVMRRIRDAIGVAHFGAFTDLVNYYTDDNYKPQLDINIHLQGGHVQVAGGAVISGSQVGDIAGVVLRDNNFNLSRNDLAVPEDVRRERLTQRFLQGLVAASRSDRVVLFFNGTEKMPEDTERWLWGQLLRPVFDGELPNVRAVLLGQREPPLQPDISELLARVMLKPLGVDDIDAYIAKRAAGVVEIAPEVRRGLALMLAVAPQIGGRPAEVASNVDLYLKTLQDGA